MKSIFERISIQQKMNLPFVVYRKPNSKTLVGLFQKDDHLYSTNDFSEKAFVFAPFSGTALLFPFDKCETKYNSIYFEKDFVFENDNEIENIFQKEHFIQLVQKGIEVIKDGVFSKLVLSRKEQIQQEALDLFNIYEKILYKYPNAFCYWWHHPKIGTWLGATPEKLFSITENKLHTMALAGTQAYKDSENVIWKKKEQKEQKYVTDYIIEQLQKETSEIKKTEPYTSRAGNLLHLRTDIDAVLAPTANLQHIIQILHPTPAVCGLPKDLAKAFIETSEGYDRTYYTGFLGEINHNFSTNENETHLFVNLRCMEIDAQNINIYIGCGITKDSNPEHEWEETVNKAKTMKTIL
ncbi:isochorismate synthase [Flavobacterium sp.]|uniref:isochorismate synthase n=1 Tax=Flavobacterium sp. TaxID=239 RepID=UPI003D11580C